LLFEGERDLPVVFRRRRALRQRASGCRQGNAQTKFQNPIYSHLLPIFSRSIFEFMGNGSLLDLLSGEGRSANPGTKKRGAAGIARRAPVEG
jgi:hypothetical protein